MPLLARNSFKIYISPKVSLRPRLLIMFVFCFVAGINRKLTLNEIITLYYLLKLQDYYERYQRNHYDNSKTLSGVRFGISR